MNFRRFFLSHEKGAVAVEAAIALPLSFALLFVFQDALVVTYNMVVMRFAVEEGVRLAALGPQCRGDDCGAEPEKGLHTLMRPKNVRLK